MTAANADVIAIGLICLDILPEFMKGGNTLSDILVPGKLVDMGKVVLATGGSAANTGQSLHRLGFATDIVGKIGDDGFGRIILDLIRKQGERLTRHMIVSPNEGSSYTICLNPPGIDRVFLHSPSTNNTFAAGEVPDSVFAGAKLLHFGYPPIMEAFALHDGRETKALMQRAKRAGLTTSLDMARPDPDSPTGKVNWPRFLENVLPHVDVFVPSIDEIIYMIDRPLFDSVLKRAGQENPAAHLDIDTVASVADRLLALGPAIVGLKLGDQGFYVKVTADAARLAAMGPLAPKDKAWAGCEYAVPCRKSKVVGTTGAGDATIAGFLGSLLKGLKPDEAAVMAVAVGGASVEAMDAISGVPTWEAVRKRLEGGWAELPGRLIPGDWVKTETGARRRE